jgi:diketogulonate reductase-like aldo/keto reductase
MKTITTKYDKTPAQIFFKFLNTQGVIPLSGTKDQTHMIQVIIPELQVQFKIHENYHILVIWVIFLVYALPNI